MKQSNAAPQNLDQKIDAICAADKLSLTTIMRRFDLRFREAGNLLDGMIDLGLIEHGRYGVNCKIIDQEGLKQYLRKKLVKSEA